MRVCLPYGGAERGVEIPDENFGEVLVPQPPAAAQDPSAALAQALKRPIGTPPLTELASSARSAGRAALGRRGSWNPVVIVCDDISRPTPAEQLLDAVVPEIVKGGYPPDAITFLVALGSHRVMTPEETRRKLGRYADSRVRFPAFDRADEAVVLGEIGGVPVMIDRSVAEAELVIGLGSVFPHPAAGWSGGAKILFPGVSNAQTVGRLHTLHGLSEENLFGRLDSPMRLEIERWAAQTRLDFILNVVLLPDNQIVGAGAGHFIRAHREVVAKARAVYEAEARKRPDIVVAGAYPAEADLWQAGKALIAADLLVEPGAILILLAPCPEGIGPHPDLGLYTSGRNFEEVARELRAGTARDPLTMSVGLAMARIARKHTLFLVSDGLDPTSMREAGFEPFRTLDEAVAEALRRKGPRAIVSVIPYGSETVPVFRPIQGGIET